MRTSTTPTYVYQVKRKFWPAKDVVKLGALSDHWPVWLSLEMQSL